MNRPILTLLALTTILGCEHPIDQRDFNPHSSAGIIPKPPPPKPEPPPPTLPPLIEIPQDAAPQQWQTPLTQMAKAAIQRRSNVLFIVDCLVPMKKNIDKDVMTLDQVVDKMGKPVTQSLLDGGVPQSQIEMSAMPDPDVKEAVVRVYVQ